jgi:hypothetical protein
MMRIKKRYIFCCFLFICLIAVSSIYIFKDYFIKLTAVRLVENLSDTHVTIEYLAVDPDKSTIHIRDLRMYNPKGFPEGILIEMPEITLVGVRVDFKEGKIPIEFADIEITDMTVIRNSEGKLNIDELRFAREAKETGVELTDVIPVQKFEFSMKRVLYTDHSKGGEEPLFRVYDVGIKDKTYGSMMSIADLFIIIFHEAIGETTIKGAAVAGIVTLGGPVFLPLGAAVMMIGKDSASAELDGNQEDIFLKSVAIVDELGKRTKTRKFQDYRIIKAVIEGHNVIIKIRENGESACKMTVYARKYMMPAPHFASTVLYQISQGL